MVLEFKLKANQMSFFLFFFLSCREKQILLLDKTKDMMQVFSDGCKMTMNCDWLAHI